MNNWKHGLPPQDNRIYHVRQISSTAGGHRWIVQSVENAFWDNGRLVRRSQFHGGLVPVILTNRWKVASQPAAQQADSTKAQFI